jgi:DNA-binding beta-propeller fold protein YncE
VAERVQHWYPAGACVQRACLPVVMAVLLAACVSGAGTPVAAPAAATGNGRAVYRVYVANESSDIVTRIAFRPGSEPIVEANTTVGQMPTDIDGPHGLSVSPDGRFWYVSLAHGTPYGKVWQYAAGADTLVGRVELGLFPASLAVAPDGQFLYVVNFNLHGDHVPSSVSVVFTPTMTEIARPATCTMPHGSRLDATGTRHYSTCMMDDQLVELDARRFAVSARFSLAPGAEHLLPETGHAHAPMATPACSPTWAQPGAGSRGRFVYVACNRRDEILEIDTEQWRVTRRFATGRAPYNLAVTPRGDLLLATLKGAQALAVFDLQTGRELGRVATSEPVTHGVLVTPDGRYAFVTNESRGTARGTVDIIELATLRRVGSARVARQPGGIDFWPGGG